MSAAEEEVYRRRKTSRCENSDTRQRVIGGIGRRKASSTNAIKGRIQQFTLNDALTEDALEDAAFSSDSSRLSSVINSPRVRRSSSNISSRSNSGSIAEIRASRRSRSNSSASSSTGSTSSIAGVGVGVSVATTKATSSTTKTLSSKTSTTTTTVITTILKTTTTTKSPSITTTPPTPTVATPTTKSPFIPTSTKKTQPTTTTSSPQLAKTSATTFPSSTKLASPSKYAPSLSTSITKARTTPITTTDSSTTNKTSSVVKDITDSNNVLNRYGAMNTPGRTRRVSVATTTGTEVSQSNLTTPGVKQQRSESTCSLGQDKGSLMRSKQMKWESLANENETKQSEEKSRTPSLYRRKISSNDLDLTSASSGNLTSSSSSNIIKKETEKTTEESLFSRNGTLRNSRSRFRTIADENDSLDKKLSVATTVSPPKSVKSSPMVARKPMITKKDDIHSKTEVVSPRKTSHDKLPPPVAPKKSTPPPVAPKKKISPFHKTSTGIAQLQSQLEKDFDSPATTITKKTTTSKSSTTSPIIDNINNARKTSKNNFVSNSTTSLLQQKNLQQQKKEKNSATPIISTSTPTTSIAIANNDFLANNKKNNNNNNTNKLRDINNNNDSSSGGSVDLVKKYFGGDDSETKPEMKPEKPDNKTHNVSPKTSIATSSTGNLHKRFGTDKSAKTSTTTSSGVNKSFDVFKTREENERKNITSMDEQKRKEKDGSDKTNDSKVAIKTNTESKLFDENEKSVGFKNPSLVSEENKHSKTSSIIPSNKLENKEKIIDDYHDISHRNSEKTQPQTSLESVSDKKSSDIEIRHDNANYAGTESIANSSYAVEEFVDHQSGLSQQKRQEGDIFSTENSLHRRTRTAYVNEKSRSLLDPSFDVDDNTKHTNGINCDDAVVVEKKLVENNSYAKLKTTGHRDRSNTWTTSDSDESIISSDSDQSSSEGKEKTASTLSLLSNSKYEGRRKLRKKRSTRSKTRPKVFMRRVLTTRSIDTSDGDILDSNYTSDDFSTSRSRDISSAPESTICESDLNENYESLDISLTNKNLNLSTVKDNIETQSTQNNHNNKILVSEATIKNSKISELKEANRKQKIYDGSMKSSSMTTISKPLQQQNLMSVSSTNMGGSRSEDEGAKLFNLHKNRDERIGSVTSISKVRVIQTFNPAPFNPPKKRNGDHQQIHSPSYTDFSLTNNNSRKPIQASPFSLLSYGKQSQDEQIYNNRQSDEDNDRKARLEKLKQGPFPDGEKPFQLTSKSQIPDEESKKAEEILESLPNSPFYMSERLVQDICNTNEKKMQSKSTGSLAKTNNHIYISKDIDIEGDFSPASSPFKLPKSQSFNEAIDLQQAKNSEFIAPPENFKDEVLQPNPATSKKIMSRPPLDFSSKTFGLIDDIDEDRAFEENPSNGGLRRPSYLRAQDSEENADEIIPKVPPPPGDADGQDSKVNKKRLRRPGLPKISTSTIVKGDDLQKTPGSVEDQSKFFIKF